MSKPVPVIDALLGPSRLAEPEHPLELYVGPWSNRAADPRRPVATGAAP